MPGFKPGDRVILQKGPGPVGQPPVSWWGNAGIGTPPELSQPPNEAHLIELQDNLGGTIEAWMLIEWTRIPEQFPFGDHPHGLVVQVRPLMRICLVVFDAPERRAPVAVQESDLILE